MEFKWDITQTLSILWNGQKINDLNAKLNFTFY